VASNEFPGSRIVAGGSGIAVILLPYIGLRIRAGVASAEYAHPAQFAATLHRKPIRACGRIVTILTGPLR